MNMQKQTGTSADPQDLFIELMRNIRHGHLDIPENITALPERILDGRTSFRVGEKLIPQKQFVDRITSVTVPGTVKHIEDRAFANCENLRQISFGMGVECMGSHVFAGCEKLKSVILSASVKEIDGWTFRGCGLDEPVFSADKKVLIYYPQDAPASEYTVPEGVEEIGCGAFNNVEKLTRITLPGTLKRIKSAAFLNCGFSEIMIPAGVQVERSAFHHTTPLNIRFEESMSPMEYKFRTSRSEGASWLFPKLVSPPQEEYWKTEKFSTLAKHCAQRSSDAMDKMGDYFAALAAKAPEIDFYRCAEIFWRTRAFLYGSEKGRVFLEEWFENHPHEPLESPNITEDLFGWGDGRTLNALGFMFFDPDESYTLTGMDSSGVVEVHSYCGEDGPDEDGFGREIYYNWWYLDDRLNLPEGSCGIYNYSNLEKRSEKRKFKVLHDRAAAAVKSR